ncbi:MAG: ATP synthase F1 subunit delta [Planctomycetes bacterium]|nr:ATP synthase F1 subunit delta [Planctomycetota bacterium]
MGARDETLANVYATALLDLAFEKGVHAEILAELRAFDQVLEAEPQFASFLNTPNIAREKKKGVVTRVFGPKVSDFTLNFLKVVIDKRRQQVLRPMIREFIAGYHQRMGEMVVKVQTAVPLAEGQRARLTSALKAKFDKEVVLEERVSPRILGGLVLQVGDTRIDGSLRSRLETIGARLEGTRFRSQDYYEDQG